MAKQYKQSDIESLYRQGNWNTWGDLLNWIEQRLSKDAQIYNEFSESESRELLDDVRRVAGNGGGALPKDPAEAFRQLQG